jgi:hypothetical protein
MGSIFFPELGIVCPIAPTFLLRPGVSRTAPVVLVGISFSELVAAFSLLFTWVGSRSSTVAWLLGILTLPSGDAGGTDCSGGDGRGEDECLPFVVVVEDIPDLWTDLGGPLTANGAQYSSKEGKNQWDTKEKKSNNKQNIKIL